MNDRQLERIADSLERIANALEHSHLTPREIEDAAFERSKKNLIEANRRNAIRIQQAVNDTIGRIG